MSWREALSRAAASARLRVGEALDAWADARCPGDGPTYEEAVEKVLEEGGDVSGSKGTAYSREYAGPRFGVWYLGDEVETYLGDNAIEAARAFVTIEREGRG